MQTAALPNEMRLVVQSRTEPNAFAEIYDHYFDKIYNFVRYRVSDAEISADLTALIFEKALANINRYQPEKAPFSVWLFTIARNSVNDHLRKQSRRRWLSLEALRGKAGSSPGPDDMVVEDEMNRNLLLAVQRLSQQEQEVIALKFAANMTNRHIGKQLGLKESHVGVILFRAVRRLRIELELEVKK